VARLRWQRVQNVHKRSMRQPSFLGGALVLECLWTAMNHTMVGLAYLFYETAIQSLSEDVVQTVEHSVSSYRKGRSLDARPCFQTV